jgi:hypothetical protein
MRAGTNFNLHRGAIIHWSATTTYIHRLVDCIPRCQVSFSASVSMNIVQLYSLISKSIIKLRKIHCFFYSGGAPIRQPHLHLI